MAGGRPLVAGLPAISGQGLVARLRLGPDRWSLAVQRLAVGDSKSSAQSRPATSGRMPAAG
jgi:hypothetical protein